MSARAWAWALAAATATAAVAYDPRAPAADPKRALALLLAVVALAAAVVRPASEGPAVPGAVPRAVPRAVRAFVGFVAWSGVTLAWGAPAGARDLAAWVAAAGAAVVILRWPIDEARRTAERAAVLAGGAAAGIATAQRLSGARGLFVHGGQGNANWLGLLLALTLPLTIGLAVRLHRERAAKAGVAVAAAGAIQIVGLALSHSRVAWAATALVAAALTAALVRGAPPARWRVLAVIGVALAIAVPFAAFEGSAAEARAPAAVENEDVPVAIAWKGRVWIWRSSADAAASSLPFGVGLGGFAHAYLEAQGLRLAELEPKVASRRFLNATTAHQDWLEVLVDAGLPALTLLALALGCGARAAARGGWPAGAAAIAAVAVCAAGDSPLRQPGVVLVLGLVLGGCADPWPDIAPNERSRKLGALARVGLLLAAAWLLAVSVSTWIGARRLTAAKEALPGERRALLAAAARVDPRSGEIALERGLLELSSGDAEAALVALRRSWSLLANIGTEVAIGNAEASLGRPEAAIEAYQAALRRHPGSFRAHANVTQPLLALGRIDEADRHLAIATQLWPGHPRLAEMREQIRRARSDRATGD